VSHRRSLTRVLLAGVFLGGGVLAVAGGLALRGPGLIGVGLAATLAACTAAGIAREAPARTRGSAVEAAVWAAGCTAGVVLVVAGIATLAGDAAAVLAVAAGGVAFLVVRGLRGRRAARPGSGGTAPLRAWSAGGDRRPASSEPTTAAHVDRFQRPVTALTTQALGDEWVRTTAALAGRLAPAARQALVTRREEALDELERRDPDGFTRWLFAGATQDSDPAAFVRGGPAHRGPVADTDAA
jgi:hypothetical protein